MSVVHCKFWLYILSGSLKTDQCWVVSTGQTLSAWLWKKLIVSTRWSLNVCPFSDGSDNEGTSRSRSHLLLVGRLRRSYEASATAAAAAETKDTDVCAMVPTAYSAILRQRDRSRWRREKDLQREEEQRLVRMSELRKVDFLGRPSSLVSLEQRRFGRSERLSSVLRSCPGGFVGEKLLLDASKNLYKRGCPSVRHDFSVSYLPKLWGMTGKQSKTLRNVQNHSKNHPLSVLPQLIKKSS